MRSFLVGNSRILVSQRIGIDELIDDKRKLPRKGSRVSAVNFQLNACEKERRRRDRQLRNNARELPVTTLFRYARLVNLPLETWER